jgi:hypothetical protein
MPSSLFTCQKLSADLDKEKARSDKADKLETDLASAQEIIEDIQLYFW